MEKAPLEDDPFWSEIDEVKLFIGRSTNAIADGAPGEARQFARMALEIATSMPCAMDRARTLADITILLHELNMEHILEDALFLAVDSAEECSPGCVRDLAFSQISKAIKNLGHHPVALHAVSRIRCDEARRRIESSLDEPRIMMSREYESLLHALS